MGETFQIALTPREVEQLLALHKHGTTQPGDLITHGGEKALRKKGLTGRTECGRWCMVNATGVDWLRMAGLIPQVDG